MEVNVSTYKEKKLTKKDIASVKVQVGQFVRDAANRYTSVPAPTIWELMEALFDDWVKPNLAPNEQLALNMSEAACWLCVAAYWYDTSVEDAPGTIRHALESLTATVEMSVSQARPAPEASPEPKVPPAPKIPANFVFNSVKAGGVDHIPPREYKEYPRKGEIGAVKVIEKTAASFRETRAVKPRCKGCKEFVAFCTCEESEKDPSTDGDEENEEEEEQPVPVPAGNGAGGGADGRTLPLVCAPPRSHLAFRKAAVISDSTQWLTALQAGAPLDDLVAQLVKLYVRCPELYSEFGQKKTNEAAIEQIEDLMRGAWELQHEPGDVVEILRVNLGQSVVQATQGSAAAKAYKASHFKDEVHDKERRALKAAKAACKDDDKTSKPTQRQRSQAPAPAPGAKSSTAANPFPKIANSVWNKMTAQERKDSNKERGAYKASLEDS